MTKILEIVTFKKGMNEQTDLLQEKRMPTRRNVVPRPTTKRKKGEKKKGCRGFFHWTVPGLPPKPWGTSTPINKPLGLVPVSKPTSLLPHYYCHHWNTLNRLLPALPSAFLPDLGAASISHFVL